MLSVAGAVSSLLQGGQKCNSKPKITGCEVKQQRASALCLCCRAVARVRQKEGNALRVVLISGLRPQVKMMKLKHTEVNREVSDLPLLRYTQTIRVFISVSTFRLIQT